MNEAEIRRLDEALDASLRRLYTPPQSLDSVLQRAQREVEQRAVASAPPPASWGGLVAAAAALLLFALVVDRAVRPADSDTEPLAGLDASLVYEQHAWTDSTLAGQFGGMACTTSFERPRLELGGSAVYAEVEIELQSGESIGPLLGSKESLPTQAVSCSLLGQPEPSVVLFQPRTCEDAPALDEDDGLFLHQREVENVRIWELNRCEEPVVLPRVRWVRGAEAALPPEGN